MRFTTFILKNLMRRKTRTVLTITGVSIPVMAVVALVGIADGFRKSFGDMYGRQGVDVIVIKAGCAERLTSYVDVRLADDILALPNVARVDGSLVDVVGYPEANLTLVPIQGRPHDHFMNKELRLIAGRKLTPEDTTSAVVGKVLAKQLGVKVGDPVDVEGEPFTIVGIAESYNVFENGSVFVPMSELQRLLGRSDQVTGFAVMIEDQAKKSEAVKQVCEAIEDFRDPRGKLLGLSAMPTRDFLGTTFELKTISTMAWVTSFVALIVGGIGMLNTMIMSVFERTREIGILRALGWRRKRVIRMILAEAAIIGVLGALLGTAMGYITISILARMPDASLIVSGEVPFIAIAQGFGIALLVGLIGGIYPALRASRMSPTEAIRHE